MHLYKQFLFIFIIIATMIVLASCYSSGQAFERSITTTHQTETTTQNKLEITTSSDKTNATTASETKEHHELSTVTVGETEVKTIAESPQNHDFFKNSVFVGDSIMEGIRQYVARARKSEPLLFSDAKFLTTTIGITLSDLINESSSLNKYSYKGVEKDFMDILKDISPSKIFILLGANDLALSNDPNISNIVKQYDSLLESIKTVDDDFEIIVLLNPPKVKSTWLPNYVINKKLNSDLIKDFVNELQVMCERKSIVTVDLNTVLTDESGHLPDNFSRDGYIHLNDESSKLIVDELYKIANQN